MKNISAILFMIFFVLSGNNIFSQVEKISYRGYIDCYRIANDSVEVIIVTEAGARVLKYALNGKNMMYEDFTLNGKTLVDLLKKNFGPDGARFDIKGKSATWSKRDTLWMGPYTAEITGNYSVKMTSMVDQHVGIDICREFFLDSTSSQLRIRHTMTNRSTGETNWYFWDRIFSPIGGKVMIPINPDPEISFKWGWYDTNNNFISQNPSDPLVQTSDTIFSYKAEITNVRKRYGIHAYPGWIVYGYNGQLYLIRFNIDKTKTYHTDSGEPVILFTDGALLVELEPTSPPANLMPGESYTFEEEWWLLSYPDALTNSFDGAEAAAYALSLANASPSTSNNEDGKIRYISDSRPDIYVFPNPANDILTIKGKGISRAELYTVTGTRMDSTQMSGDEENFSLRTDSIPGGFYFVKVFFGEGSSFIIRKIMIVKG